MFQMQIQNLQESLEIALEGKNVNEEEKKTEMLENQVKLTRKLNQTMKKNENILMELENFEALNQELQQQSEQLHVENHNLKIELQNVKKQINGQSQNQNQNYQAETMISESINQIKNLNNQENFKIEQIKKDEKWEGEKKQLTLAFANLNKEIQQKENNFNILKNGSQKILNQYNEIADNYIKLEGINGKLMERKKLRKSSEVFEENLTSLGQFFEGSNASFFSQTENQENLEVQNRNCQKLQNQPTQLQNKQKLQQKQKKAKCSMTQLKIQDFLIQGGLQQKIQSEIKNQNNINNKQNKYPIMSQNPQKNVENKQNQVAQNKISKFSQIQIQQESDSEFNDFDNECEQQQFQEFQQDQGNKKSNNIYCENSQFFSEGYMDTTVCSIGHSSVLNTNHNSQNFSTNIYNNSNNNYSCNNNILSNSNSNLFNTLHVLSPKNKKIQIKNNNNIQQSINFLGQLEPYQKKRLINNNLYSEDNKDSDKKNINYNIIEKEKNENSYFSDEEQQENDGLDQDYEYDSDEQESDLIQEQDQNQIQQEILQKQQYVERISEVNSSEDFNATSEISEEYRKELQTIMKKQLLKEDSDSDQISSDKISQQNSFNSKTVRKNNVQIQENCQILQEEPQQLHKQQTSQSENQYSQYNNQYSLESESENSQFGQNIEGYSDLNEYQNMQQEIKEICQDFEQVEISYQIKVSKCPLYPNYRDMEYEKQQQKKQEQEKKQFQSYVFESNSSYNQKKMQKHLSPQQLWLKEKIQNEQQEYQSEQQEQNEEDNDDTIQSQNQHKYSQLQLQSQNQNKEQIQHGLNKNRREILIDWLIELGFDHCIKRDTIYNAINLFDRYAQLADNIEKSELQLIGATCLFISSKQEEVMHLPLQSFVESTANTFTQEQFIAMEKQILKTLRWRISPVTLNTWLNFCLEKWDQFILIQVRKIEEQIENQKIQNSDIILFKSKQDLTAYQRYLEISNMLDCTLLEPETLIYSQKALVLGFLYIFVGLYLNYFEQNIVIQHFYNSSMYLIEDQHGYNSLFESFLAPFGLRTVDLLPSIQYAATYFKISNFDAEIIPINEQNAGNIKREYWESVTQNMLYNQSNQDYIHFRKEHFNW
ncbi:Cyclin-like protein [Pseudocohnilembus persalinus]|uniref:Cyclin-like protein n=1 Tax=Pseudocohnilembus persalinus TaxID=266149 RepID=A0A0V0QPY5_PSEPJ|nr:Cyclin-like protein [Pseudocohnilembus persalinus]|eukprot:KRX04383.1 Cyclin-like protein [Pseudocohnilembus persalinus]